MTRYFSAERATHDDFAYPFTGKEGEVVYDAKTKGGPWAMMSETAYKIFGAGKLGTGYGQKYVRNAAGELHKVKG